MFAVQTKGGLQMRNGRKRIAALCAVTMLIGCLGGCDQTAAVKTEPETVSEPVSDAADAENAQAAAEPVTVTETPEMIGFDLLWSDEFDGTELNREIWNVELRDPGWTNNELQAYVDTPENVFVQDGYLHLKAIETEGNGRKSYTSGKVQTQNKRDFMYGKVVVRAKVPKGQGLWPAAWMMPTEEEKYGQWPKCGEIDIMEVLGNDTKTAYATVHYGEPHGQQQGVKTLEEGSFSDDFHEYAVEWTPGKMIWTIDFVKVLEVNDWFTAVDGEDEKPYPAPFNQNFFVQLNLAVGGTWPGNPDETTDFSQAEFLIDYVRVYQKDHYKTDVKKPVIEMREPLEDGNYVRNGDFADESEDLDDGVDWKFLLAQNGSGAAAIKDGKIEITSEAEGDVDYSVQLVSWDIPLKKDSKYRITFDAKASKTRDIVVAVTAPYVDWIRYFPDTILEISDQWETYEYEFEMTSKTDPRGRLEFNLGHRGSIETVDITNVRFEEITE